jgi:hypothetical protein
MLLQYTDVEERQQRLSELIGIENTIWMQVEGYDKVYAIADEDLERDTEEKTSSVHFLRFELDSDMAAAVKAGADISAGVEHENYTETAGPINENLRASLASDIE